jgi:transposase
MSQQIPSVKVIIDYTPFGNNLYQRNGLILLYIAVLKRFSTNMLCYFNIFDLTFYETYYIFMCMASKFDPYQYFTYPQSPGQKQYEALRSFYMEKLPARIVAEKFNYTVPSFNALRQKFKTGKLAFQFTGKPGPQGSRVPKEIQERIFEIRRTHNLSSYRIAEILAIEGYEINPRTINRLLQKAGFPPAPRRAKLAIGETVTGAKVPREAHVLVGGHFPVYPFH